MLSSRKQRIVREVCRAASPSREPCCLIPAGTGETGEGIGVHIHAANSQGDRAKKGCRSSHRHNANSLWERVESCMTLVDSIVIAGTRIKSGCLSRSGGVKGSAISGKKQEISQANGHPTTSH